MSSVIKFIYVGILKTIKYWGAPLLFSLLFLVGYWIINYTWLWIESVVVFLVLFMFTYAFISTRKTGSTKYSKVT